MSPAARAAALRSLPPAFAEEVLDAQACFREAMEAMARPGVPRDLPAAPGQPAPLQPATAALLLTLCDLDTPVWLDHAACDSGEVAAWLRFHRGTPIAGRPEQAAFAVVADPASLPLLDHFRLGDPDYPDRGATLLIQVADFRDDRGPLWSGPGIAAPLRLQPLGLPDRVWAERRALAPLFPLGLDLVFTAGTRLVALPRSTRLED